MSHYKVMNNNDCYGVSDTRAGADAIVAMHKNSKTGSRAPTKASTLEYSVVMVEGSYPPANPPMIILNYKPGKYS